MLFIVGEKEQIDQKLPTLDSLHFATAQHTVPVYTRKS